MQIQIKKGLETAAEAVAFVLCHCLKQAQCCQYPIERLNSVITDYKIKRLNTLYLTRIQMLYIEIEAIQFLGGRIDSIPMPEMPTPPDYENMFKSWGKEVVDGMYNSAKNLVMAIDAFMQVIEAEFATSDTNTPEPEQPSPEAMAFAQYIADCKVVFQAFLDSIPFLAEFAYRNEIYPRPNPEEKMETPEISAYSAANMNMVKSVKSHECLIKDVSSGIEGIVYGIVLEPGSEDEPDLQGQWIDDDQIEKSCHEYMTKFGTLGYMHSKFNKQQHVKNPSFRLIENYIVKDEDGVQKINGHPLKKGTWIQAWKIIDPAIKDDVVKGRLTGFSVGGYATIKEKKAA